MGFLDKLRRRKDTEKGKDTEKEESARSSVESENAIRDELEEIIRDESSEMYTDKGTNLEKRGERFLKVTTLFSLSDTSSIMEEVSAGNIVIADISPLKGKDELAFLELKRSVEQLKGFCRSIDGDIAQLGDHYIVITPNSIKIWRGKKPLEKKE
ncbi:MAG: cell division protein SepF [Candidatus Odinarchaeia archaeon]